MAQQFREVVILLTKIRFKQKLAIHRTSSKVISKSKGMVPVEVIEAVVPVGKLTIGTDDGNSQNAFSLEILLYHGNLRSKPMSPNPQLRLNIEPWPTHV